MTAAYRIARALRAHLCLTAHEIATETGLAPDTVRTKLAKMRADGIVAQTGYLVPVADFDRHETLTAVELRLLDWIVDVGGTIYDARAALGASQTRLNERRAALRRKGAIHASCLTWLQTTYEANCDAAASRLVAYEKRGAVC